MKRRRVLPPTSLSANVDDELLLRGGRSHEPSDANAAVADEPETAPVAPAERALRRTAVEKKKRRRAATAEAVPAVPPPSAALLAGLDFASFSAPVLAPVPVRRAHLRFDEAGAEKLSRARARARARERDAGERAGDAAAAAAQAMLHEHFYGARLKRVHKVLAPGNPPARKLNMRAKKAARAARAAASI